MNIATVYAWFARESVRAAEKSDDVRQRQMVDEVGGAVGRRRTTEPRKGIARQSREEASAPPTTRAAQSTCRHG